MIFWENLGIILRVTVSMIFLLNEMNLNNFPVCINNLLLQHSEYEFFLIFNRKNSYHSIDCVVFYNSTGNAQDCLKFAAITKLILHLLNVFVDKRKKNNIRTCQKTIGFQRFNKFIRIPQQRCIDYTSGRMRVMPSNATNQPHMWSASHSKTSHTSTFTGSVL